MFNRLSSVLVLSLMALSGAVYAASVCNTLPECIQLRAKVDTRIQELQAGLAPQFGDIVRGSWSAGV